MIKMGHQAEAREGTKTVSVGDDMQIASVSYDWCQVSCSP